MIGFEASNIVIMLPLALLFALKISPPAADVKYLQPQLASTGDMIGLAFGSGNSIFYTYSTNDGATFARPVEIETGGHMALGRHRGPRIAIYSGNVVISAVVGEKGKGQDGDILAWRSGDNGKTWSKPVRVNDIPGSAREGLHAMASGNGWIVAVWLDLRDKGTSLYWSKSDDGGATWSKSLLVYESPSGTICQCCHPSVLVGPGGAIHVMWRNSLDGSRDMYVTRSTNGGKTWLPAKKVGRDTWVLNACPMDGGSFTVTGSNNVYTTWRRDKKIYVANVLSKESELGEGKDPALASGLNEALYAVWTAPDGIKMRNSKTNIVESLSAVGAHPQILFTGRSVLAFWEQDGGIAMGVVEGPVPLLPAAQK